MESESLHMQMNGLSHEHSIQDTDDSMDAHAAPLLPSHTQCEISVLNSAEEYNFHDQADTGRAYDIEEDYFVFKVLFLLLSHNKTYLY